MNIKPILKNSLTSLDSACHFLQEETDCPDEAINQLLGEAIGTWQLPNIEQLDLALRNAKSFCTRLKGPLRVFTKQQGQTK